MYKMTCMRNCALPVEKTLLSSVNVSEIHVTGDTEYNINTSENWRTLLGGRGGQLLL